MTYEIYNAFAALTADGNTAAIDLPGHFNVVSVFMGANATYGSGTLKLQVSSDGGTTWVDVPSGSWTSGAASTKKGDYTVIGGKKLRVNLAGATNPNLSVVVRAREDRDGVQSELTLSAQNTSTAAFKLPKKDATFAWSAFGTFGGGTVSLQASPDGGTTWFTVDTMTAAGVKHVTSNEDTMFRISIGAATTPSLTLHVFTRGY